MDQSRLIAAEDSPGCESTRAALNHATGCGDCSERLTRARQLSRQMRLIPKQAIVPEPIPEHLSALRSAFRAHHSIPPAGTALPAARTAWKPWVAAAAAMLAVTLAGVLALQHGGERTLPPSRVMTTARPIAPLEAPAVVPAPEPEESPITRPEEVYSFSPAPEPALANATAPQNETMISEGRPAPYALAPQPATYTYASRFYPLLYGGDPMLLDSAPIVRVEVSGAMLQLLGFPVVGEPSSGPIQADLLLGEDGLARAIRFVQ